MSGDPATQPRAQAPATNSLFEEDWWLDAVSPATWIRVQTADGGAAGATWPFAVRRRWGFTSLVRPPLTPFLGPWLDPGRGKLPSRLSHRKAQIEELVRRLPPHHRIETWIHPECAGYVAPFQWSGFHASPHMTYVLPDISDPQRIWAGFTDVLRNSIRKAERTATIRDDQPIGILHRIRTDRLRAKGLDLAAQEGLIARIDRACCERGARLLLTAHDPAGEAMAAVFIVFDSRCAFYLLGGLVGEQASGAPALLLWEAIRRLSGRTRGFDFEGSMVPSIEHFFRSFGGDPTVYYRLERSRGLPAALLAARGLLGSWNRRG